MKKINRALFSLSLIVFILFSCKGDKKRELVRTWQVSNIETQTELDDSVRQAMISGSTIQFTEDGKYTTSGGIGADQGTYTLDKDGKTLSTISTAGKSNDVYTVEELSKEKLVLSNRGTTVTYTAIQ